MFSGYHKSSAKASPTVSPAGQSEAMKEQLSSDEEAATLLT
jgi:hypothetical protein